MTIPTERQIADELLYLLAGAPLQTMYCRKAIHVLASKFPRLTDIERWVPKYRNGDTHWENRVRFAREQLAKQRLLLRPSFGPLGRGYWTLSTKGVQEVASSRALAEELVAELESLPDVAPPAPKSGGVAGWSCSGLQSR